MDMFLFFIGFFTGIIFMALVSVGVFYAMKTMFSNQPYEQEEVNAPRKRY